MGDAVVIRINNIKVTSIAASSGVMEAIAGTYKGDPFVHRMCPKCGREWEETYVDGIGWQAIKCKNVKLRHLPSRCPMGTPWR